MSDDAARAGIAEMLAELTAASPDYTAPVPEGYGIDLLCWDDATPNMQETQTETTESLAQDNYHRLITPEGSLPDDLDYGKDITGYLSRGTSALALMGLEGEIATELLKDDRNASVSAAVVVRSLLPCELGITIEVTPANPDLEPFKMLLGVDNKGAFLEAIQ